MRVFIRVDASVKIGTGHVMRCLTLARALKQKGAEVEFVCAELPGNFIQQISTVGFFVHKIQPPSESIDGGLWPNLVQENDAKATRSVMKGVVDWVVVDHYGLDISWEAEIQRLGPKLFVIDDLANRSHVADVLLDQNFYSLSADQRYKNLVPERCELLLGPRFSLINEKFREAGAIPPTRYGSINRVLVFFGGSDPTDETSKVLDLLSLSGFSHLEFDIVVGASNPKGSEIAKRCTLHPNVQFYCQTTEMARICSKADIAIAAGGSAQWERCAVALPSIVVVTADNQIETVQALHEEGYIRKVGWHAEVSLDDLYAALDAALVEPDPLYEMGSRSHQLVAEACTSSRPHLKYFWS